MPDDQLLAAIEPLIQDSNGGGHLSLDDWAVLLNSHGEQGQIDAAGQHLIACRACSQALLDAEEYAEKVRDRETLIRLTPRYVPDSTPSRLILDAADGRVWIEQVEAGWLLASMELDVEAVAATLPDASAALNRAVRERSRELLHAARPVRERDRRAATWLRTRGGEQWADRFAGELPILLEGASTRIESLGERPETAEEATAPQAGYQLLTEAQIGDMPEDFRTALQLAQTMLNASERPADPDIIRRKVRSILAMLRAENGDVDADEELLVRELQARYTTFIGTWSILDDQDEKHRPWLHERKAGIQWRYWRRYERFLREKKGWVPASLSRLGDLTDEILDRLEDPTRPGAWDRRGLVVGGVQAGKTANYTGLICKAADAGYKLIVVMAGLHNNLRSQTQWRLDEGFLGWDTQAGRRLDDQPNQKIGVGRLRGEPWFTVPTLTSNAISGDFNRVNANQAGIVPGGNEPVLLVVKKRKNILENVRNWALQVLGEGEGDAKEVRDVPLLLIDDEADNASINTRGADNPTEINKQIRLLLNSFTQSAYVGYTATPFANIFVPPDDETPELGRDIFPKSFIINIPAPSNYVGPVRFFGLAADPDAMVEPAPGLPIVRSIDDYDDGYEAIFPPKHKIDLQVAELPRSLKEAIRAFILVCAARRARGQTTDHNSMLVHVTRFTSVQKQVDELIMEELSELQRRIEFSNGSIGRALLEELEGLWRSDFGPTSARMVELAGQPVTWEQVRAELHSAAARVQTRTVNSESQVALDYVDYPNGLSVIVIGGNKLSRGLTLEGLSVSYYLRHTNMYDTLMQMGRWFGYRPGYLDLCRLYTTEELRTWYRHIALVDLELRREFEHMKQIGATPEKYGLRVRTHPEGMLITAINKMRRTVTMQYSYSGRLAEVSFIDRDPTLVTQNRLATAEFVNSLGEPARRRGNYVWQGVSALAVVEFLSRFHTHPHATSADTAAMARYIEAQNREKAQYREGELANWTVALISNTRPEPGHSSEANIGRWPVVTTWRDPAEDMGRTYAIRQVRIINPPDEYLDLNEGQYDRALEETIARYRRDPGRRTRTPVRPSGDAVRSVRPPQNGLLILYPLFPPRALYNSDVEVVMGHAVSFPESPTATGVEYRIGELFWRQQIGDEDEDED